jgi:hypothetical protein
MTRNDLAPAAAEDDDERGVRFMTSETSQVAIKTGVIGCGAMGRGLVYQPSVTPGIDCVAVADLRLERCTGFLDRLGLAYAVVEDLDPSARARLSNQRLRVCKDDAEEGRPARRHRWLRVLRADRKLS